MLNQFILITGRTSKQAIGMHKGKHSETYRQAVVRAEMSGPDMERLGLSEGQCVRIVNDSGRVEMPVFMANLPDGMLFIPMGPEANRLIGTDTQGKGMPSYKGQKVEVETI